MIELRPEFSDLQIKYIFVASYDIIELINKHSVELCLCVYVENVHDSTGASIAILLELI